MEKTAGERRAARKRKQQERRRGSPEPQHPDAWTERELYIRRLVVRGAATTDEWDVERVVAELAELDPDVDSAGHATRLLIGLLRQLWENGWQPADVAHVVRRRGSARPARLLIAAIAEEARTSGAAGRAPEDWTTQLSTLGALTSHDTSVVASWSCSEGLTAVEAWRQVLQLMGPLGELGPLQMLTPPPSQWGSASASRKRPGHHAATQAGTRVLGRIRALLAKAESTEFPEEADALTAKAQQLMTRHAVDAAVLDAEQGVSTAGQVRPRRVHLDNPYPEAKVRLLDAIATVNGVRCIWLERVGMATLVGLPADLDSVDLLFTSLLVQAIRAMTDTGRAGKDSARSPSFRRAFLISYAIRIGERLSTARLQATEEASRSRRTDLVPVLRSRTQAVDDVFTQMFPETYSRQTRSVDGRGWHAGRAAADTADLGSGRDQVSR